MAQYKDPFYSPGYESGQYEPWDPPPRDPPPRDPAWAGPVPVVRRYLNRIQRDFIKEEFKALKETGLYLLEAHVGHVELEQNQSFVPKEGEQLTIQVTLPTLELVAVSDDKVAERKSSTGTRCSERCSSIGSILYSIYSETRHLSNLQTGPTDLERTDVEVEELEDTDISALEQLESALTRTEEATRDILTIDINEGKAVLRTLSGLEMIQSLQQHPIRVRARVVAGEGSSDVIGEVQTTMMYPEAFRQAVLVASRPEAALPMLTTSSGRYPLLDGNGLKVGDITLTLSLTCLGCAVVNCLQQGASETVDEDFSHALVLRTLFISSPHQPITVGPCIFGHNRPYSKTSEEVLQSCIDSGKLHVPPEARLQCDWYRMAQETEPGQGYRLVPGNQQSISYQEEHPRFEVDYMLRNHKRMCREVIQRKDEPRRRSVLERLNSLLLNNDVTSLHHSYSFSGHISRTETEGGKQS